MATLAPKLRKDSTSALPIPSEPPVTTTTLLGRFPIGTHIDDVYTWVNKERERLKLPLFKREVVSFNISTLTHTFMPKNIKAGQMKLRK